MGPRGGLLLGWSVWALGWEAPDPVHGVWGGEQACGGGWGTVPGGSALPVPVLPQPRWLGQRRRGHARRRSDTGTGGPGTRTAGRPPPAPRPLLRAGSGS